MKLIKKAEPPKSWSKELTCTGAGNQVGGCGAVLLVELDDVFITKSAARGDVTHYNTFRCQECGVLTDIPDGMVPRGTYPDVYDWARAHGFRFVARRLVPDTTKKP